MKKINKSNSRSEFLFNRNLLNSKRSQSHAVSVTLMIFIVIVVAGIIWNFSSSYVKSKTSETQGESFYYNAELYLLSELATGGYASETFQLGVKRTDNEQNITGVRFIFEGKGISNSYDNYTTIPNNAGIIEVYELTSEDIGMEISEIKKISLMLLYENKKPTEVLDEIEI